MACMAPAGGGDDTTKTMVTSAGYNNCFSDTSGGGNQSIQPQVVNQFHQSFDFNPVEMYGLTSGMELLGFPQKQVVTTAHHHDNNSVMWKEYFGKSGGGGGDDASASKAINDQDQFYHHQDFSQSDHETLMGGSSANHEDESVAWQNHHHHHHHQDNRVQLLDHDPTAMRSSCVFPCEGNERPSQGLSLSLGGSDHPARIGLQSFELRQPDDMRFGPREGFFGKSSMNIQHQQQQQQQQQNLMQDRGILGKVGNLHFHQNQFQIRSSKYLGAAQELLNEFCNLGTKQMGDSSTPRLKIHKPNQLEDQENAANTSSRMQSLYSIDLLELQKRKAKLLQMLEEVDRRYKHYCDQMKAVVSSFEAVAGNGAATVYSSLASKAMSRHFRSLRDGIINEIKATKKALGEKDAISPGGTRGETPRLRLLDQTLRQQRAFQQMSMMETHPWRPQRGLPERAVSVLRAWLFEHFLHPYPSEVDKHILARQTGLSRSQVSNWFINARVRLWKPMVEEMYVEETKEQEGMGSTSDTTDKNMGAGAAAVGGGGRPNQNPPINIISKMDEDLKPTHEQLVRIDSECLSSIIHNNPDKINVDANATDDDEHVDHNHQQIMQHNNMNSYTFGALDVDFSSSYAYGGGGGGGGVSLTLGLQQHGGGGGGNGGDGAGVVSLGFSPTNQNSLFYSREHIENCPVPVQYSSLLDSESQNLPYRNLMGAQLLHDLAG